MKLIDSYSETNQDASDRAETATNPGAGQALTITQRGILNSIKWFIKKVGSPTGNAVAKVYEVTGTVGTNAVPTGAALATSDNVNVAGLSTSYALTTFSFSGANKILLVPGHSYALTIEYTNGIHDVNYVEIGADNSSAGHAGNEFFWNSGAWAADNTYDECFYLYVDNVIKGIIEAENGVMPVPV